MQKILVFVAGIIEIVAPLPYIIDTIKNKTHPNIVTWFTWTLINGINAAAAFNTGAWQTGIYALCATVATGAIVLLGLWRGVKKYTAFDIVCQLVALLGIPLWIITDKPELAVLLVLIVDFAGGLPTLRHAWRAPGEESWQTFAYSALAAMLLLISLPGYTIVAVAMPLYIFLFDLAILFSIFYRKKRVPETQ